MSNIKQPEVNRSNSINDTVNNTVNNDGIVEEDDDYSDMPPIEDESGNVTISKGGKVKRNTRKYKSKRNRTKKHRNTK